MRNLYFKEYFLISLPIVVIILWLLFMILDRKRFAKTTWANLSEKQRKLKYNINIGKEKIFGFFSMILFIYFLCCFVFLIEVFTYYAEIILNDKSNFFVFSIMIFDLILFLFLCFILWKYSKLRPKLNNRNELFFGIIIILLIITLILFFICLEKLRL